MHDQWRGWLRGQLWCALTVIAVKHYAHQTSYSLAIPPSPNLPNDQAVVPYSYLSFFGGTTISAGRSAPFPFQVLGYPNPSFGAFRFAPVCLPGKVLLPKHQDQCCFGIDLRSILRLSYLYLRHLLHFCRLATIQELSFLAPTFEMHAGSVLFRQQIEAGCSEKEIRASWQEDLKAHEVAYEKYLLYD